MLILTPPSEGKSIQNTVRKIVKNKDINISADRILFFSIIFISIQIFLLYFEKNTEHL